MSEQVLTCSSLMKTFHQGETRVEVLRGVNLQVKAKQRIAIIGYSGSGKSTLLHLLGGLDLPSAGRIEICGQDLSQLGERQRGDIRNHHLGFVYQFHHLLPEFSAEENVALPLLIRGVKPEQASQQASELLAKVGLSQRLQHKPAEMSGGERQRTAIARALVTQPRLLLADEPTGNLDQETAEQVFELMMELNQSFNTSLVMVTHNTDLAGKLDECYRLQDGQLQKA